MADVHARSPQKTKTCRNIMDTYCIAELPEVTASRQRNPLLTSSELHVLRFPNYCQVQLIIHLFIPLQSYR